MNEDGMDIEKSAAHFYISPAGSTRKAGRRVCSLLEGRGYSTSEFDLARYRGREEVVLEGIGAASLLLAGSPVFASHAAQPVMSLLESLPPGRGKPALAYVTYGGVSSGSSLYEMARALDGKGYVVTGLAEVLAPHSMMFLAAEPLGSGHPGEEDWKVLASWIGQVSPALKSGRAVTMDYSRARPVGAFTRLLNAFVFTPRSIQLFFPPVRFRSERCDGCGTCREVCPARRLDRTPEIDESRACMYCYQCVRRCPKGAFSAPVRVMYPGLRALSRVWGRRSDHSTRAYV